ncbi:hypothetical protein BH10PSE3_BH10PSE3_09270 [soil metagenome]
MTDTEDEWRASIDENFEKFREHLDFLCIRHSAIEWFVEQVVANLLVRAGPAEADRFLDAMCEEHGHSWLNSLDGPKPVPQKMQTQIHEQIVHVAEKIRARVHSVRRMN